MDEERSGSLPDGLRLERMTSAGDVVVLVHGDVDVASAARVRDEIVDAAAGGAPFVTVDTQGVTFIDSSGLSALVEARDRLRPATSLRLAGVDVQLRRLLEISGLASEFPIVDR